MKKSLVVCAAPALLTLAACGDLPADDAPGPVLAEIRGTLDAPPDVGIEGDLRVAVIWARPNDVQSFLLAQSVEVEPVFPAGFRLVLREPPVAEAMISGATVRMETAVEACSLQGLVPYEPSGADFEVQAQPCATRLLELAADDCGGAIGDERDACEFLVEQIADLDLEWSEDGGIALGSIVAFDDRNRNGELDPASPGRPATDRILGAAEGLGVVWAQGERYGNPELPQGYTVFDFQCGKDGGDCGPVDLIRLSLAPSPRLQKAMCTERSGSLPPYEPPYHFADSEAGGAFPSDGVCSEDGLELVGLASCETEADRNDTCNVSKCYEATWYVEDAANPAAGWPCEIAPTVDR